MSEASEELFRAIEMHLSGKKKSLREVYDNLRFVLMTVSEPWKNAGPVLLIYSSGEGQKVGSIPESEAARIVAMANLKPGDITISAYYPEPPLGNRICVSISKVLSWEDCDMPRELFHIWPIDEPEKSIDPRNLSDKEIEDKRNIKR
ncbi:MAG: hypothetical protein WD712_01040 [Candidatus Spechtbacterales bacterium]